QADSKRVWRDRATVPSDGESSGPLGWNGDREYGEAGLERRGMALRIVVPLGIVVLSSEVDRFTIEAPGSRKLAHALVARGQVELRSNRWLDAPAGLELQARLCPATLPHVLAALVEELLRDGSCAVRLGMCAPGRSRQRDDQ